MNSLLKLVVTALLALNFNSWCHASNENVTLYRPFRIDANEEIALPCWELLDASHLVIWITPAEVVIGPNDENNWGKYAVDNAGSLVVNVRT
jgi:hypothetical protein